MNPTKKAESCDYNPLKECLAKNDNDRSKCMKEWDEFQRACREKKRLVNDKSECEAYFWVLVGQEFQVLQETQ